ncbi:hypothetical protein MNBD_ALPHA04-96 [hydrothermal vent metagenome]|uniref:Phage holin family protein n=1 Tax=hydrothermal vent metagenome TaxID=652676 RepID=A0A3B0SAH5_9ZZZZ
MTADKHPEVTPVTNDEIASRRLSSENNGEHMDGDANEILADEIVDEIAVPNEKPLADQISEVIADARALADAEIAYFKAKIDVNIGATKKVLAFFGFGIALIAAGLTALIFGLLLTLAPYIGPGPATAVVAGISILSGAIFLAISVRRARSLPLDGDKP